MPLYHHHPPSLGHNTRRTPASEHNAQPCHVVPRSSPPAQARCVATALSRRAFAMLTPHAFARASAAAGDDPSPRGHHRRRRHRTQSPQARRSVPLQAQELQRRGPSRRACIISCLASSVVRADEPRLRMQESLIVPFWLCFLFSFPQIALLSWLLKRAPSKRQASLLGASTFMMYVPSFQQRTCLSLADLRRLIKQLLPHSPRRRSTHRQQSLAVQVPQRPVRRSHSIEGQLSSYLRCVLQLCPGRTSVRRS